MPDRLALAAPGRRGRRGARRTRPPSPGRARGTPRPARRRGSPRSTSGGPPRRRARGPLRRAGGLAEHGLQGVVHHRAQVCCRPRPAPRRGRPVEVGEAVPAPAVLPRGEPRRRHPDQAGGHAVQTQLCSSAHRHRPSLGARHPRSGRPPVRARRSASSTVRVAVVLGRDRRRLVGAVVVAGPGGDQPGVRGHVAQRGAVVGRVVGVVDLDAPQAPRRPGRPAPTRSTTGPRLRAQGWANTGTPPGRAHHRDAVAIGVSSFST